MDVFQDTGMDVLRDMVVVDTQTDAGATVELTYTGRMETYAVPIGFFSLRIVALGASGGDAVGSGTTYVGGNGSRVDALVAVSSGETLTILVGQRPDPIPYFFDGCGASGGGGTFVVRGPSTALVVAGAGAAAFGSYIIDGGDATTTSAGGASGVNAAGSGGTGGTGEAAEAGGGGGLTGDGTDGEGFGGDSFTHGGAGGSRAASESCGSLMAGGFGGGGGGGNDLGGGGGGHSGGAAQDATVGLRAGGGGSYSSDTAAAITIRTDHGHGRVSITPF